MEDDEEIVDDGAQVTGDPMTCLVAFKNKIVNILEDNDLAQKRAAKMDIVDFLQLLSKMNEQGVHFQ